MANRYGEDVRVEQSVATFPMKEVDQPTHQNLPDGPPHYMMPGYPSVQEAED